MRLLRFMAMCLAFALAHPAGAEPKNAPRLTWHAPDGEVRWTASLDRHDGVTKGVLTSTPWYKPLPDLEVRLFGGGVFPFRDARGSVLVIDFWAAWCGPCREELPRFQAIYEEYRDAGLEAIAINVGESPQVALPYAEDMGLTMPIGIYQEAMTPTLYGKALPVLVVADRQGRIRGRWDGYEPGFEEQIVSLIRRLLDPQGDPQHEVARVLEGQGKMRIRWMRETQAAIEDLWVLARPDAEPAILVSHGRLMSLHKPDGQTEKQWAGDRAAGRVRLGPSPTVDRYRLAGFRPGAKEFVLLDAPGGDREKIAVDSYVFDVAWLPASWRAGDRGVAVGTMQGLLVVGADGSVGAGPDGFGSVSALDVIESGGESRLLVLESGGRLSWVDRSLELAKASETDAEAWLLVVPPDASAGVGVGSNGAFAGAAGRFVDHPGRQVAVASNGGILRVLSLEDGSTLFAAAWDGLTGLAAGDLDGDGLDELVVAQGKHFAVLTGSDLESHPR